VALTEKEIAEMRERARSATKAQLLADLNLALDELEAVAALGEFYAAHEEVERARIDFTDTHGAAVARLEAARGALEEHAARKKKPGKP
jgi:hypothetical protein